MHIHVHIHNHPDKQYLELLKQIAMTQSELAVALASNTSTLNAIANDVATLVNAGTNVIPEVESALSDLTNATNNLRNAVPQAPQP